MVQQVLSSYQYVKYSESGLFQLNEIIQNYNQSDLQWKSKAKIGLNLFKK